MEAYRILVADDNQDLTDSLITILSMEGHHAVGCYSGEEARVAIQQEEFDLVILDIKLPDVDGVHLFREIKETLVGADIFIITGYRITQVLERILGVGAAVVIEKPPDWEGIFDSLWKHKLMILTTDKADFSNDLQDWLVTRDFQATVLQSKPSPSFELSEGSDVVILDIHQSILANLDVYLTLREKSLEKPTIALIHPEELDQAVTDPLGSFLVTGCLFKPFAPSELLERIQNLHKTSTPASKSE